MRGDASSLTEDLRHLWKRVWEEHRAGGILEAKHDRSAWFTEGCAWMLEPFYAERMQLSPGKALDQAPKAPRRGDHVFYMDDRVVMVHCHQGSAGVTKVAFRYETDDVLRIDYDERQRPQRIVLYGFDDGTLAYDARYWHDGDAENCAITTYSYDGPFLRDVTTAFLERGGEHDWKTMWPTSVKSLEYGPNGQLAMITSTNPDDDRRAEVVYRHPGPGWDRDQTEAAITAMLEREVDAALAPLMTDEREVLLAMSYDGLRPLPPLLMLTTVKRGNMWRRDWDVLNPAEWMGFDDGQMIELTDGDLRRRCEELWSYLVQHEETDRAVGLLNDVARRVNAARRATADGTKSPVVGNTPDAFVYAIDPEMVDLEENLRIANGEE